MKSKLYAMSPYLLVMCTLLVVLLVPVSVYMFYDVYQETSLIDVEVAWGFASLVIILILTIILDGRELISFFRIDDDNLLLYSPFRKTIKLDLRLCIDIGIDYGLISGGIKQYWFYFSMDKIPNKYFHRINRTKYSKRLLRIQYREEVYEEIITVVSADIRRKLIAAHSVIENENRRDANRKR